MPLIETLPPIRNMSPIPQADMGQLSLLAVLLFSTKYSGPSVSLGSAPVDAEGWLYYAIFYKGLEHPPVLIRKGRGGGCPGTSLSQILRDDCPYSALPFQMLPHEALADTGKYNTEMNTICTVIFNCLGKQFQPPAPKYVFLCKIRITPCVPCAVECWPSAGSWAEGRGWYCPAWGGLK